MSIFNEAKTRYSGLSKGGKIGVWVGVVLVIGVIGAAFDSGDDEPAEEVAAVTVAESTTTEAETTTTEAPTTTTTEAPTTTLPPTTTTTEALLTDDEFDDLLVSLTVDDIWTPEFCENYWTIPDADIARSAFMGGWMDTPDSDWDLGIKVFDGLVAKC